MPNEPGPKLPVPGKTFKPNAHDGGPMAVGEQEVYRFSDETKSPARADRVVKGLKS